MTSKAIAVERGCGTRTVGSVYCELGMGPGGMPLENFLICPPQVIDPEALGLSSIGTKIIPYGDRYHIWDMIGKRDYPNVADYLEEVRRFGVSRKLNPSMDFSLLGEDSRILVIHARAHIENFHEYAWAWDTAAPYNRCPRQNEEHDLPEPPMMCAGVYWQDVEGGTEITPDPNDPPQLKRQVLRRMPSFVYAASRRPDGVVPQYKPAIFASFPISRLVVINDPEGGTHKANLDKAGKSSLPVELEDY